MNGTRLTAILCAALLLATILFGCRNNDTDSADSGYVFLPEIIPFPKVPGGRNHIENIVIAEDNVFFTAANLAGSTQLSRDKIFSMSIDGSDLTELSEYSTKQPPHGATA